MGCTACCQVDCSLHSQLRTARWIGRKGWGKEGPLAGGGGGGGGGDRDGLCIRLEDSETSSDIRCS